MDRERTLKLLDLLRQYVADLVRYRATIPLDRIRMERDVLYQILYPLTMAIQSCIDLGNHIVADHDLPRPETYGETFDTLAGAGILTPNLASRLRRAARARNLFVHRYWEIDPDRVASILQNDLDAFTEFEAAVVRLLEAGEASPQA